MTSPFDSPLHVAEIASAGVRYNVAAGDALAAAALQLVARVAWAIVDGAGSLADLAAAARQAERDLRLACGMGAERMFVADVLAYAAGGDAPATDAAPERRYVRVESSAGSRWAPS